MLPVSKAFKFYLWPCISQNVACVSTITFSLTLLGSGNRSSFQNVVFYNHLEFWTMDSVHEPSDSESYTPSSEPFRFHLYNSKTEFIACGDINKASTNTSSVI
jgi:hypothetical protein